MGEAQAEDLKGQAHPVQQDDLLTRPASREVHVLVFPLVAACLAAAPMTEKANESVLVCYESGTLVYASETTVSEARAALEIQNECRRRAEMTQKACGPYDKSGSTEWERCWKHSRKEAAACPSVRRPYLRRGHTEYSDKGVEFRTDTLNCVSRFPSNQETK